MPSIRQIARQIGVPDVVDPRPKDNGRDAPVATPATTLDEVAAFRDRVLGQRIVAQTERQLGADAEAEANAAEAKQLKTELELEEQRLRLEQIRAEGQRNGHDKSGVSELLQFFQAQASASSEQTESLRTEVIGTLREEVNRLHQQLVNIATQTNGKLPPTMAEQLADLKGNWDTLKAMFGGPPEASSIDHDIDDVIKLHRVEEDHELRMAELRSSESRWQAEHALARDKLEDDKRRGQNTADILTRAMPDIAQVVQGIGSRFVGGDSPGPSSPAEAPYPPGTVQATCPSCTGGLVPFLPGQELATCTNCGARAKLEHEPAAPPPAAEPESAQEEVRAVG